MNRVTKSLKEYESVVADNVADSLQHDGWEVWREFDLLGDAPRRRFVVDIFAKRGEEVQIIEIKRPGSSDRSTLQRFEAIKAALPESVDWKFKIIYGDEIENAKPYFFDSLLRKLNERLDIIFNSDASTEEYALAIILSSKLAEDILRALSSTVPATHLPLVKLVRLAGESDQLSRRQCDDLLRLTSLRNSILHGDGFLTAGPEEARFARDVIKSLVKIYQAHLESGADPE